MGPEGRYWTPVEEVFLQEATDKLDLERRAGVRPSKRQWKEFSRKSNGHQGPKVAESGMAGGSKNQGKRRWQNWQGHITQGLLGCGKEYKPCRQQGEVIKGLSFC